MNIWNQLIKSLYSPKDIAKFRFQGIGKTILFVFFLTFLSILPTTYYSTSAIIHGLEAASSAFNNEVPPFIIENGHLTLESSTPVTIEKGGFNIILDSTNTLQKDELIDSENTIALLKDEFLFIAGGNSQSFSYAMLTDMHLTNKDIVKFIHSIDSIKIIFLPILILVIFIFSSGLKFIEVSIFAAIGILLAKLSRKNVHYRQLWRMAAYSVTLPTIFFTLMSTLQTRVPNSFLINSFVIIIVLTLALKEIPAKK